mmetsp:Transcript_30165/g.82497  ORF Transcript_30165/g.82497 Transcript_30165/m.82497 type:complete len:97 (+) Transcript_30165:438-728(+)
MLVLSPLIDKPDNSMQLTRNVPSFSIDGHFIILGKGAPLDAIHVSHNLACGRAAVARRISAERLAAAATARIAHDLKPEFSSASTPAIVVPPGEQT